MSRTDPQSRREIIDRPAVIERARLDEAHRARHAGCRPTPGGSAGCRLGAAAQTRSKAGGLRRRRTQPETTIRLFRQRRGTDRTTEHARRLDPGKETSVESRIAIAESAVAALGIESGMVQDVLLTMTDEQGQLSAQVGSDSPYSDIVIYARM